MILIPFNPLVILRIKTVTGVYKLDIYLKSFL